MANKIPIPEYPVSVLINYASWPGMNCKREWDYLLEDRNRILSKIIRLGQVYDKYLARGIVPPKQALQKYGIRKRFHSKNIVSESWTLCEGKERSEGGSQEEGNTQMKDSNQLEPVTPSPLSPKRYDPTLPHINFRIPLKKPRKRPLVSPKSNSSPPPLATSSVKSRKCPTCSEVKPNHHFVKRVNPRLVSRLIQPSQQVSKSTDLPLEMCKSCLRKARGLIPIQNECHIK